MTFRTWATAPVVAGRPAHLRKRMSTLGAYKEHFERYFGYVHYTRHLSPTFDHLFDLDLVTAYVEWHINDCHHKVTQTILGFLKYLLALTKQYRPLPELRAQLVTLMKTLPSYKHVPPVYNKADAWVSLASLEQVARSLWPRKKPTDFPTNYPAQCPGLKHASQAGISLMLRLWTYILYRLRNICEMQLDENLREDEGKWHIVFRGEQLKISSKRGRLNVFDLPFPATLVPLLKDYLTNWRPLLLSRSSVPDPHVFLTQYGTPYQTKYLRQTTQYIVYRYTGKYWHPHIVRTVWATEMILKGVDLLKVAMMLNDKLETVIKNYAHLLDQNVAEEVYALIDQRNGQGK